MKNNNNSRLINKVCISRKKMIGMGVIATALSIVKMILAFIYQYTIDNIRSLTTKEMIISFGIVVAVIIVAGYLLGIYESQRRIVSQTATYNLQCDILNKKMQSELVDAEKETAGEWLTIVGSDCKILADLYPFTILGIIRGAVPFILAIAYGAITSYRLTAVIILCSFFATLFPKRMVKRIEEKQEEKQANDEGVRGHAIDCINNVALIKSYNAIDFFVKRFEKLYDNYAKSSVENAKIRAKVESVNVGIGFLMNTIWMIIGILMIMEGDLRIGSFIGFMVLSDCYNWPFFELPSLINNLANAKASSVRLSGYNCSETIKESSNYNTINTDSNARYTLKNVCFRYDLDKPNIINNYSACIGEGVTAIVGESGCGKSTLLKLLSGLYTPLSGSIQLNIGNDRLIGHNISERICFVSQNNQIFTDSVYENIRYGNVDALDSEIEEAARLANVDGDIKELPQGYKTIIGDNSDIKLSTGQLQRIGLARGILRNAEVFLLDEVTSGQDETNQQMIISNLLQLDKTIIIVTHNREMLQIADKVIRMP